jgi:hypothetical protein
MFSTTLALATLGALACAVVYGTDVFAGFVLRPALAALDDGALVQAIALTLLVSVLALR